jgi:hypothetical protein
MKLHRSALDFTVTLWDVLSSMCLVVFHGPNGHTDQVLCVVGVPSPDRDDDNDDVLRLINDRISTIHARCSLRPVWIDRSLSGH